MVEQVTRTKRINSDGSSSAQTTEVTDDSQERLTNDSVAARIVWLIAGIILTLLAFRFVLILLGANSANGFVSFIYNTSHPFAAPFFGIFSYKQEYGQAKFELSTLIAMAVYALVAYGLARLLTIRRPSET